MFAEKKTVEKRTKRDGKEEKLFEQQNIGNYGEPSSLTSWNDMVHIKSQNVKKS